ncbi:MAG: class I tRNA ligase family protein, partial [Planctomycetota bacterium]
PVRVVIQKPDAALDGATMDAAYVDPGVMTGSGPFDGRTNTEAMGDIIRWLETEGHGEGTVNYRLRDWLLSRQRYWGAPIPIVYCDACGTVPVPEADLPVELPMDVDFGREGGNPLEASESFVHVDCPACGKPARRETDTMDTFVDSSWYFLRYCSPDDPTQAFDPERVHKWMPVDLYIGGIEHATMHLIYCRFFTRVLHDLGYLRFAEPAARLFCQGMVCKTAYYCEECKWLPEAKVEGGEKQGEAIVGGTCADCGGPVRGEMTKISKSKLNIVDPDAMMDRYGADCVRLYMLSDAPPDQQQVWSDERMQGAWRFLNRLWDTAVGAVDTVSGPAAATLPAELDDDSRALRRKTHIGIRKITEAIEGGFRFNTAISSVMELLNQVRGAKRVHPAVLRETVESMLLLMAPIVPHFAEELWQRLGHEGSIFGAAWPEADEAATKAESVEIPIQVNGKIKARLTVAPDLDAAALEAAARADPDVADAIADREIKKVVAVPGRIVNIAVK